ncbi:MAG: hypothetical protein HYZ14_16240 [Bacteroidetes bacterium]|nr:hypothetical protein [Bacteroidota bacterium]
MKKHVQCVSLRGVFVALFTFCFSFISQAQNLEKIGGKDMLKVTGGLAFNTITYFSSGLAFPSREPFTWYASGNVNVSILDVSLPFTYTYSNQGGKFTQPFNRTALNPTYKWVKSTLGLTSMNFSPYTLTGHLFLGAGVELTPGKWKIALMAGRLNKEVAYDALENNLNQITFRRFGYGLKCGYENKGFGGTLILFKAKDNETSLPFIPLNSTIKPQDNFVFSLGGKAALFENLFLEAEYAASSLTQNLNEVNGSEGTATLSFLNPLVHANATTAFFQAYKTSIKYQLKWMNVGFNFEHIDPGYKTLGGYYFNNDLNNYTFSPAFMLFDKRLNIGANTGFQRNNLAGDKAATTLRWVGSINASFVPSPKLVFSGTYSNFSTFTKNRPATDPFYYAAADTMNFYQLTQSASAMSSYNFGKSENKNVLQLMYTYQQSASLSGAITTAGAFGTAVESGVSASPMNIHCANLAYSKQFKALSASLTFAANVNRTVMATTSNTFMGPTVNFQKSLFQKKSTLAIGSTYNRQYTNDALLSNVFNHRISFTFSPKFEKENTGKMNFSLNANWMQKLSLDTAKPTIQEVNLFVNLNYSF